MEGIARNQGEKHICFLDGWRNRATAEYGWLAHGAPEVGSASNAKGILGDGSRNDSAEMRIQGLQKAVAEQLFYARLMAVLLN